MILSRSIQLYKDVIIPNIVAQLSRKAALNTFQTNNAANMNYGSGPKDRNTLPPGIVIFDRHVVGGGQRLQNITTRSKSVEHKSGVIAYTVNNLFSS